jgi:TolB-like protein
LTLRSARYITVLLILALALPVLGKPSKGKRRKKPRAQLVAIFDIRLLGIDEDTSRRVLYDLRQAFGRAKGFKLISEASVQKRLKRRRVAEDAPIEKVVRALRVHWVITGTLGGLGDEVSLDLKLLDRGAKEVRRVGVAIPLETRARRAVLDELLVRLLVPDKWAGTLVLDCSESGAQVQLDGSFIATTPLDKPLEGLKPGKHILRITKEGYGEFSRFVVIRHAEVARLKVDLKNAMVVGLLYERGKPEAPTRVDPQPEPEKPPEPVPESSSNFQKIAAWTFLGVGAGLGGAGVGLAVAADQKTWGTVLATTGGVMLAGSLILFLVGGGDDGEPPAETAPGVSIVPALVPGGAGVGVVGRF